MAGKGGGRKGGARKSAGGRKAAGSGRKGTGRQAPGRAPNTPPARGNPPFDDTTGAATPAEGSTDPATTASEGRGPEV
jgi:hypothetical protein